MTPLTVLDGVWLPIPFLRFNPPRTFVEGPDNWARPGTKAFHARRSWQYAPGHRRARQPDCRACDVALSPVENDILNGTFRARLARQ